ncbi:MAG: single-stranded DNA-binding protein [Lentisphaeria bacterium]|nr:single-stranded DNA-binding protein [Lentisphaeria bacterium]
MINQTFLTGNLVRDPEYKDLPSGAKVCNLRIAHSRKFTDNNGNQREETLFIGVQVFGKQATHCHQFLQKGSAVVVAGRLQQREYQTKDGSKRNEISIMADSVQFMDGRPQQNNRLPDSCRQDYARHNQPQPGSYAPPMPAATSSP